MKKIIVLALGISWLTVSVNAQTNTFPATGSVGIGTTTPAKLLHLLNNDTPCLRLEQTNAVYSPYTWDVAGNEAGFFIRDVTAGSALVFRIFPACSTNTLTLKSSYVGIRNASPLSTLDVNGTLRIAYDSNLTLQTGMVRYYNNDFNGYNGTDWVSFTKTDSTTLAQIAYLDERIDSLTFLTAQVLYLGERIDSLEARLDSCCAFASVSKTDDPGKAVLYQNNPNPFNQNTTINFYIPRKTSSAVLIIHDLTGKQLKKYSISEREKSSVVIQASEFTAGIYNYSLLLDGKIIGTKKMILID
jgi:hypothetical protein